MISDITLGQFFPGYSPLHKMDPRTKILLAIVFIVAVFLVNNPVGYLFITLITAFMVIVSRISPRVVLKGVKPIVLIIVLTSLLNVFLTKGEGAPLLSWRFITVYKEGIIRAVTMALRVILLIIGSSMLLTYTTSPISLTDGIESLLSPLKKIKVPVHSFAMMMSIALRFIPTLIEETEKIMNAQKSRGADFSSGGLLKRAKALIPILVPLFVSSIKRADELATAMECRCYRGDKNRTKLVKLQYKSRDYIWLICSLFVVGAIVCLRIIPDMYSAESALYSIAFYKL